MTAEEEEEAEALDERWAEAMGDDEPPRRSPHDGHRTPSRIPSRATSMRWPFLVTPP